MKLSRQTREIINVVIFVVVLAALVTCYVVYPLNKSKTLMARADGLEFTVDSLPANSDSVYTALDFRVDTFRVESDGVTNLACVHISAPIDTSTTDSSVLLGTVIVIPDRDQTRDSLAEMVAAFVAAGYDIVTYDPRASGRTSGQYRGEGQYEADDLEALLAYLDLRDQLHHPVSILGLGLGGEAALLAAPDASRADQVIAVRPYLSTEGMFNRLFKEEAVWWFPFRETVLWFWYNTHSGYAASFRYEEDIKGIMRPTVLLVSEPESEAIARLRELSSEGMLTVEEVPDTPESLQARVLTILEQSRSAEGR